MRINSSVGILSMEKIMLVKLRFLPVMLVVLVLSAFLIFSTAHGRSPRSKQYFKWVQPHVDSNGRYVPGHWNYIGPPKPGIEWVPGHFDRKGEWVVGRWVPVGKKKENQEIDIEEDFGE